MNERELKMVISACDEGSFLAASRKLFISQSALSQAIRKLEESLGQLLFIRSGNRVRPTEFCREVVSRGRPVLEAWENFEKGVESLSKKMSADVQILAHSGIIVYILLEITESLKEEYPDLRFSLLEKRKGEICGHLKQHPEDLGFVFDVEPSADLVAVPVLKTRIYLAVPKSHPYALAHPFQGFDRIETADLSEFKNDEFALPGEQSSSYKKFMELFQQAGFLPKIGMEFSLNSYMRAYVNAGRGLTLVNSYVARNHPEHTGISYYALDLPGSERVLYACRSKGQRFSPVAEELVNRVAACQEKVY